MRNGVFGLSLVLAAVFVTVIGLSAQSRTAYAIPGDVCEIVAWDSTGRVLEEGDTAGGDGMIYVVFRVEDDSFGFLSDFIAGPVQDLVQPLQDQVDDLNAQIVALGLGYDADTTSEEIAEVLLDLNEEKAALDPNSPTYVADLAAITAEIAEQNEAMKLVVEREAVAEELAEILAVLDDLDDVDLVQIDSQTGSARITSKAEVTGFEWVEPRVSHILVQPGVGSQYVDHIFPDFFTDPDGNNLDSIPAWLDEVAGVPVPDAITSAANVCGGAASDGWGFVDLTCIEAGSFHINVIPHRPWAQSELTRGTLGLACPGDADTATISASPTSLETQPVGTNTSTSTVTVTVLDRAGDNLDGAEVTFTTDTCTFSNPNKGKAGDLGMSPAGGGMTVTTFSDTDSTADANFLTNNPLQESAGTAELSLNCASGKPGTVTVTAIVQRPGADIVLTQEIELVGPPAALELSLTPEELECGEVLVARIKAVDVNGKPVSDGTRINFTTDTSSGIIGGVQGAQGSNTTVGGETTVTIAVAPNDPGTHTVIAYFGGLHVAKTFECESAVAPAAPTQPAGGGGNNIKPPSTGDAGLAASGDASLSYALLAGLATIVFFIVGIGANRLSLIRKAR